MSAAGLKLGREDYKKKKELEELRKLGAAPAEVDDQGFIINPHIPQYMAEAPWYITNYRPGLNHQRLAPEETNYAKVGEMTKKGIIKEDDENNLQQEYQIKKKKKSKNGK